MSQPPIVRIKTKAGRYVEHPLTKDEVTVGRSVKADITIDDSSVSRIHFKLVRQGEDYLIVDNGSSNGTYLRKRKVIKERLQDGDDIFAGRVHIYFANKAAAQANLDQGMETIDLHANEFGETAEYQALSPATPPPEFLNIDAPTPPGGSPFPNLPRSNPYTQPPPPVSAPPTFQAPSAPPPFQPAPPPSFQAPPVPAPPMAPPPSFSPPPSYGEAPFGPPVLEEEGFASPVHRLLAVLIDGFLAAVLYIPVFALFAMGYATIGQILMLIVVVFLFLHPVLGWLMYGKTLGKHFLGLRIVMVDAPQQKGLSFKAFIMRVLGYMICGFLLYIPFITVITDPEGRGFHDKMAGTRVVKKS